MASIGFLDEVTFEQRSEESNDRGHVDMWGERGQPVQMPQILSMTALFEEQHGGQGSCSRVDEGESARVRDLGIGPWPDHVGA